MHVLRNLALGAIGFLVAALPLLAHHDWPVDQTKEITVKGTVTAYRWADPHVMIDHGTPKACPAHYQGTRSRRRSLGAGRHSITGRCWTPPRTLASSCCSQPIAASATSKTCEAVGSRSWF